MKRIFVALVLEVSDAAIADTPERAIGDEESRIADCLSREYDVQTVDVFRLEHYS